MLDLAQAIVEAINQKKASVLATVTAVTGDLPAKLGAKVLFLAGGEKIGTLGWEPLEQAVVERVATTIEGRTSTMITLAFPPTGQGGLRRERSADILMEVLLPRPTLLIVGAGHIAVPLAKMGKLLEFEVVVLDDRASFANRERFPEADKIIAAGFETALREFPIAPDTYIVLITRGHQHDIPCLWEIIDSPAAYIGMIGSRRRVWAVLKLLHQEGMPLEKLRRIHAPIGLDIGAQTPAEIAASIIGEVIKVHRGGRVESISDRLCPRYMSLLERGQDLEAAEQEAAGAQKGFSEKDL